jgi:hypothetical protein
MSGLRWRNLPGVLAYSLLALQLSVPWWAHYYVTMDGPSHLYTARVALEVLLGRQPFHSVYRLQTAHFTNWTSVFLLNTASVLFGSINAEKVMWTLSVASAFWGFSYLARSLNPSVSRASPVFNFLAATFFLWAGFYNFYLATILYAVVVGYFVRTVRRFRWRDAAVVSAGLAGVFVTHIMPAALGVLTILAVAGWAHAFPHARRPTRGDALRLLLAVGPAAVLLAAFWHGAQGGIQFNAEEMRWAWNSFPFHVFASDTTRTGGQILLWPGILFFIAIAALGMRREEWMSARGALLAIAAATFGMYLLLPDAGLDGSGVKIRFAWLFFVLAGIVACTVGRIRPLLVPVSIYVAVFSGAYVLHAIQINVRNVSRAVAEYMKATEGIAPGSTVVRLRFPTEQFAKDFGFVGIPLEPMLHLDALIAVRQGSVALSDYQALTRAFPVVYGASISEEKRWQLWYLEGTSRDGPGALRALRKEPSIPIDYVIVLGDNSSRELGAEYDRVVEELGAEMKLVSTDSRGSFVRVYKRTGTE